MDGKKNEKLLAKKIKDKIERDAEKTSGEMIENKIVLPLSLVLSHGATPWAEWCERFIDCKTFEEYQKEVDAFLQWLEGESPEPESE